jgi:hypothetical protein
MIRSFARLMLILGALLLAAAEILLLGRVLGEPAQGLLVPEGFAVLACGYCAQAGGYSLFATKLPFQQAATQLRAAFLLFGIGSVTIVAGAAFIIVNDVRQHDPAAIIIAGILQAAGAAALGTGWLAWAFAGRAGKAADLLGATPAGAGATD